MGFDVYGYSENQLINNVLDLYERHLTFIHLQDGKTDLSDNAEPERLWREDN